MKKKINLRQILEDFEPVSQNPGENMLAVMRKTAEYVLDFVVKEVKIEDINGKLAQHHTSKEEGEHFVINKASILNLKNRITDGDYSKI
jgi:hypothetical protein